MPSLEIMKEHIRKVGGRSVNRSVAWGPRARPRTGRRSETRVLIGLLSARCSGGAVADSQTSDQWEPERKLFWEFSSCQIPFILFLSIIRQFQCLSSITLFFLLFSAFDSLSAFGFCIILFDTCCLWVSWNPVITCIKHSQHSYWMGIRCNFVKTFMLPRGWILLTMIW